MKKFLWIAMALGLLLVIPKVAVAGTGGIVYPPTSALFSADYINSHGGVDRARTYLFASTENQEYVRDTSWYPSYAGETVTVHMWIEIADTQVGTNSVDLELSIQALGNNEIFSESGGYDTAKSITIPLPQNVAADSQIFTEFTMTNGELDDVNAKETTFVKLENLISASVTGTVRLLSLMFFNL